MAGRNRGMRPLRDWDAVTSPDYLRFFLVSRQDMARRRQYAIWPGQRRDDFRHGLLNYDRLRL